MARLQIPQIMEKDGQGELLPYAKLYFYKRSSNEPNPPYSDNDLTSQYQNPVGADEYGVFPDIFLDDDQYDVELRDQFDTLIWRKTTPTYLSLQSERVGAQRGVVWFFVGTQNQLDDLISEGWKVADGTGGTPDLTGYTRCETDPASLPASGGNATQSTTPSPTAHQLVEAELPVHNHGTNDLSGSGPYEYDNSPNFSLTGTTGAPTNLGNSIQLYQRTGSLSQGGDQSHNHTVTVDAIPIEPEHTLVVPIIFGY